MCLGKCKMYRTRLFKTPARMTLLAVFKLKVVGGGVPTDISLLLKWDGLSLVMSNGIGCSLHERLRYAMFIKPLPTWE